MSVRDSAFVLVGWLLLCVTSGSIVTLAAQVLPS